jgi:hypothetical protein
MRRCFVAVLAALVLSLGACADGGTSSNGSSGSSSNGSSSNGSSGSSGNENDGSSSSGSSSNDGSSNNDGSSGGTSGGSGSGDGSGDGTTSPTAPAGGGSTPTSAPPAAPPQGYTLPEPNSDGTVDVPEDPPEEVRDERSPRKRLFDLPPVPRGCLDDDLTLLDIFVPAAAVPVRLLYCLVYIGTIARLPSEIDVRITAPSFEGPSIAVPLLPPQQQVQNGLLTFALILLVVVVALAIGYIIGRRSREQ